MEARLNMNSNISMKYLFEIKDSISNVDDFKHFLTYNKKITFENDKTLSFSDNNKKHQIDYSIIKIEKSNMNHFICNISSDDIEAISSFNRLLNVLIQNILNCKILLLQDGISLYYSSIAYNELHNIENSIRALLTEVMCFFGNPNWVEKEATEILNIEKKGFRDSDVFYNRNFDQLEKFLFTDYSEYSEKELLYDLLESNATIEELPNLINETKDKLPVTIWNKHFLEVSRELDIEGEQLQKLLKSAYAMRNHIAHCNKFHKNDFDKFELDYGKIESAINSMLYFIEHDKLTSSIKSSEIEESLISKTGFLDTVVVPARKEGFEEVFLGQSEWYDIRMNNSRINDIKYIAAYQVNPISAITHYAEVKEIVTSEKDIYKKRVIFKEPAKRLDEPIELGDNPSLAVQSLRYTSLDQLLKAKNLKDLFI